MKKYWIIGLVVIVLLGGATASLWFSQNFRYCIDNKGQYPASQNDNKSAASFLVSTPNCIRIWSLCLGGFANDNGNAITALATVLLTIVTGGLVWIGINQDKSTRVIERAYVGVVYPEVMIDGNRLIASIDYQNAGRTPASDLELRMSAILFNNDPTYVPPWEPPGTGEDEGKGGILLPTVIWQKYAKVLTSTKEDVTCDAVLKAALLAHKKRIWVWGTISYLDIFDEYCEVRFRFWSGKDERHERPQQWITGRKGTFIPLIAEFENCYATYGKK